MESSSGMRVMHTFKKLPITIPNNKKKTMSTGFFFGYFFKRRLLLSHTCCGASTNPGPYVPHS